MSDVQCTDRGNRDRWDRDNDCKGRGLAKEMNEAMEAVAKVFDEKGDIYDAMARGASQKEIDKEIAEYYEAKSDAIEEVNDLFEAFAGRATKLLDLLDGDEDFSREGVSETDGNSAAEEAQKKRAAVLAELNDAMAAANEAVEAVEKAVAAGKPKSEIEALIADAMEKIADAHTALGDVSDFAAEGGEVAEGLEDAINSNTGALEGLQAQLEYETKQLEDKGGASGVDDADSDDKDVSGGSGGSSKGGVNAWTSEELKELRETFHKYVGIPGIANELIAELLTNPELASLLDAMHGDVELMKGMANQGGELGVLFGTWADMSATGRLEILETLRGGSAPTKTDDGRASDRTDSSSEGTCEYRGIEIPAKWEGAPIERLFTAFEEKLGGTEAQKLIEELFSNPQLSSLLDQLFHDANLTFALASFAAADPQRFDLIVEQWPSMSYEERTMATSMWVLEWHNASSGAGQQDEPPAATGTGVSSPPAAEPKAQPWPDGLEQKLTANLTASQGADDAKFWVQTFLTSKAGEDLRSFLISNPEAADTITKTPFMIAVLAYQPGALADLKAYAEAYPHGVQSYIGLMASDRDLPAQPVAGHQPQSWPDGLEQKLTANLTAGQGSADDAQFWVQTFLNSKAGEELRDFLISHPEAADTITKTPSLIAVLAFEPGALADLKAYAETYPSGLRMYVGMVAKDHGLA